MTRDRYETTFRSHEIIGHRYWMAAYENCLFSPHNMTPWDEPEMSVGSDHMHADGRGGIYTLRSRAMVDAALDDTLREHLANEWVAHKGKSWVVIGTVMLWGTVWEHETGFRGQYGRIASIDELLDGPDFSQRLTDGSVLWALRAKYCATKEVQ